MTRRFPLHGAVPHDPAVDAWLQGPGPLRALARVWFDRLRACGPDVREVMHDGMPTACVGDAAFAYVAAYTGHVNLGFFHGATLPDPAGLLQGSGRFMRHVELRPAQVLDDAAIQALIDAACASVRDAERGRDT